MWRDEEAKASKVVKYAGGVGEAALFPCNSNRSCNSSTIAIALLHVKYAGGVGEAARSRTGRPRAIAPIAPRYISPDCTDCASLHQP